MMIYILFALALLVDLISPFAIPFYVPFPLRPARRFYSMPHPSEITSVSQAINHIVKLSPNVILPGSKHFESAQSLLRLANATSSMHEHDEKIMSQLPGTWYTIFTDIPLRSTLPFSEVINEVSDSDPFVDIVGILQQISKPRKEDSSHGTFNTSVLFKLEGSDDIYTQSIEGTYTVPAEANTDDNTDKKRLILNFITSHISTWDSDDREAKLLKLVQMTDLKPTEPRQTLISPPEDPGWITTTFLSEDNDLRVTKSNQDYTFVLKKIMFAQDEDKGPADNISEEMTELKDFSQLIV